MKIVKFILVSLVFLCGSLYSNTFAQNQKNLTGTVVDGSKMPLPGVSVVVKGTTSGTITGNDGSYKISVADPDKAILVFSFIGMNSKEVPVRNQSVINITLEESLYELEEVVAVGYGSVKRKDLTGSVSSANVAELSKAPVSDVAQALAGRVAGVMVTQSDGEPGANISIRVRGGISITQNNEPLYIIDGFPSENGLSGIEPSDIESIDVLKDASSTAIYGARGANGVVVITTKSGVEGKTTVNYDGYYGLKQVRSKLPVLSTSEFVLLDYERRNLESTEDVNSFVSNYGPFADRGNYLNRPGVDWQEEALGRDAFVQNLKVSVAGGSDKMKYLLSYSHIDEDGFMFRSGNKNDNIRLKLDHAIDKKVKVSANLNYTENKIFGMGTSEGGTYFNKMNHIITYRPTIGVKGEDWELVEKGEDPILEDVAGNVMQNPILSAKEEHIQNESRTFLSNGSLSYKLTNNLTFTSSVGMRYQTQRKELFYGDESVIAKRTSINGSIRNIETQSFQTSNTLTFDKKLKKTKLNMMVGQEWVTAQFRWFEASAFNFPNDDIGLNDLSLGAVPGVPRSFQNNDDKLLSFFGRAFVNHNERYLLTASLRADASSKFGPNNKWGYFPSASFAWRVSEEPVIKELNLFSDLKFRVGYGVAGNNRIPAYGSLAILGSLTYPLSGQSASGYASTQIPNKDLKWEANKTFNIGADIGFFDQRLAITPEFYVNRSVDLLLNSQLPYTSGFPSIYRNIGETKNTGIDLTISTVNIRNKNFSWSTNLNLSHNKNKVMALSGEQSFLWGSGWGLNQTDYRVAVGESLGQMYGYVTDGLYQVSDFDYDAATQKYTLKEGIAYNPNNSPKPGYWKFRDVAGAFDENGNPIPDGKISSDDRTVIGNATPKVFGGINNSFTYKNFDFSAFFNFSIGNDIYNATKLYNTLVARTNKNALDVANSSHRWVTIDETGSRITDPNTLEQLNRGKTVAQYGDMTEGTVVLHSWAIEDGSFLRLSNVTLGYTLPASLLKKISIDKLRIYGTANNLFVITNYSGFDPEVSTRNSSGLTPGIDWGAYPRAKSLVFGVNVTF